MKFKLLIILLVISNVVFSQKITTSIDSTKKKIGSEFKLTLKTEVDTVTKVFFPASKSFGNLEVIESYKVDTIANGSKHQLIKQYGLTQFDNGKYVIPRIKILIGGKPFYSDSLKIEINDVKVDTLKQKMYDIKDITHVESDSSWWKYLLLILALAIIGYFVYKYIQKRRKTPKPIVEVYKTPIEKATSLLQQLEKKELWQRGEVKNYYSELTDIARNYIEEEINIPAMESTTSELIEGLRNAAKQKKLKLSAETVENLEKVLKQADLVKFAKVKPLDFEIEEDKKRISSSIVTIHQSIPEVVEETNDELELWNEQQKEKARLEKLKKEKIKRIIIGSVIVAFLVCGVLGYLVATKGFDYVKDNIIGHPTRELYEGEWVLSEYGNPSVKIETPKVLKRMDYTKYVPKQAMTAIKEIQMFGYGSMLDHFHIAISTSKFKQEVEIDLDKSIEGSLKAMELQGAQNMIVKTEDFDTQQGITGRKAYGTMTAVDPVLKKTQKMYYELLAFKQDGGIQLIIIMHKEGDDFGQKIADRVLNSVELQKLNP